MLRDEKDGASVVRVFRRKPPAMMVRMVLRALAPLKRDLLDRWSQPGDVMVFGYTAEESDRLEDFRERNPDSPVLAPLIDAGLTKSGCKRWCSAPASSFRSCTGWATTTRTASAA